LNHPILHGQTRKGEFDCLLTFFFERSRFCES